MKTFTKFIISSFSSVIVDFGLFHLFGFLLNHFNFTEAIVLATIGARILSSIYNYFVNSRFVFVGFTKSSIVKYYVLVVIQMFVSAFSVKYIFKITMINLTIVKIVVDFIIFIVNYFVQKKWVFKYR